MKSERKADTQKALRFFMREESCSQDTPLNTNPHFHGIALVEEVRRLRRELKRVNKVVQRYSRALGLTGLRFVAEEARKWEQLARARLRENDTLAKELARLRDERNRAEKLSRSCPVCRMNQVRLTQIWCDPCQRRFPTAHKTAYDVLQNSGEL